MPTRLNCSNNLQKTLVDNQVSEKLIVATKGENVLSNLQLNSDFIVPCNQVEADTRIFLHVKHISLNGYDKVMIQTVDTDVVMLGIYSFNELQLSELWIEFRTGIHKRWLPIREYASNLGDDKSKVLPVWFAFTGCDTVSAFSGGGKKIAWDTWNAFPDIEDAFK